MRARSYTDNDSIVSCTVEGLQKVSVILRVIDGRKYQALVEQLAPAYETVDSGVPFTLTRSCPDASRAAQACDMACCHIEP